MQPGALQERLCPHKRSRPPKSSRGTLQESPHRVHARSRRGPQRAGESPGQVPRASTAPHPALRIPPSVSGASHAPAQHFEQHPANRTRALRSAQRSVTPRTLHSTPRTRHRSAHSTAPGTPCTSHSAPHRTPHGAPRRTPLSAPPPLSACLRRTPPGANSRPRTGFPRGSSVLSRPIACSAPFPARGRATAARPAPPSGGARGAPPGWASRLSPRNSATIAHHRCASPLKGAPYCSPLYLAERFIIFRLFPGSSVPQLACAVKGFRHSLVAALLAASLLPASGRMKV